MPWLRARRALHQPRGESRNASKRLPIGFSLQKPRGSSKSAGMLQISNA